MVMSEGFQPVERFDVEAMARFMRNPEIYWAVTDALNPPPETIGFEQFLLQPSIFTVAACYDDVIGGYVYIDRRTSIGGEIHCGFHPTMRGKIAKTFIEYTISRAWQMGFLKLWTFIPTDNRPAIVMAKACDFTPQGRLIAAMMRKDGVRDVLIFGREKASRSN